MGNRVRQVRETQQLELDALAAQVGVTSRYLFAVEEDACSVDVEVALKLARVLNSTVETLFAADEPENSIEELAESNDAAADVEPVSAPTAPQCAEVETEVLEVVEPEVEAETPTPVPADAEETTETPNEVEQVAPEPETPKKRRAATRTRKAKSEVDESKPRVAPYATELTQKTLDELIDEEEALQTVPAAKTDAKDDAPIAQSKLWDDEAEEDDAPRFVFAPRDSRKISFTNSKTAEEEGLAETPEGLVDPTSSHPVRYFDLFCGIGGFRFAAQNAFSAMRRDSECVLSCDIDPPARKSYAANFGETPFGDVSTLPSEDIPDFDLLFAGFPCQTFSIIGLRKGFADETKGSLFFQIARILKDKRPRAFVLENVRQLTTHDNGRTFEIILRVLQEELGYHVDWRVLNALDCGLPQKRERVVVVGCVDPFVMEWPRPNSKPKTLADILEDDKDVDKRYFASPEIVAKRKAAHTSEFFPGIWHENKSGNISSYPYSCALRAGASYNYLLVNGERRLTPREMLRLQGFPDEFKIVVSDTQIRKQAGNAAPVNLVQAALERFLPLVFEKK